MNRTPRPLAALILCLALGAAPMASAALCLALATPAHAGGRWQRGQTLPSAVLQSGPNVNYAAQRLRRPPDGYGWFALDGEFLLASLSSGLIVEVTQ